MTVGKAKSQSDCFVVTVGQAKTKQHLTLLSWIWDRQNNTPDCFVVTVGKAKPQSVLS